MQYLYLCPICLVIAAVFIAIEKARFYLVADVIKGVASAFFVALGVLGAFMCNDPVYARTIVIGLVLGAIADILLNLRYVYEGSKAQIAFLVGILVFLAGHIAYIVACVPYCINLWVPIIGGVVLAALLLYWIFSIVEAKLAFKVFGVFYLGAIVILNCMALFILVTNPTAHWLMFFSGTLLFLVSDVILIINTFGPKASFALRISNLMLYYVGQLLIALSLQLPL
ncbi:MAG: lysoplasmalogenase [Atopobiaceae bacterium]|nr:lysoplasmalogenase [Atopobiaceae bacterium]